MKSFRCGQAYIVARSQQLNKAFSAKHLLMTRSMYSSTTSFLRVSRPNLGLVTFKLADIGEGIAEVELLRWHIKEGDTLDEMDDVCEVQSDKSAVEISSPYSGKIIKFHHAVGDMIKIGHPLLDIEVEGEGSEAAASEEPKSESSPSASATSTPDAPSTKAPPAEKSSSDILASPACRYLAREYGINLADVPATGPGGRITKEDLINFKSGSAPKSSPPSPAAPKAAPAPTSAPRTTVGGEIKEEVLLKSGIAKGMIKSMNASLSIPTMSIQEELDMSELIKVRAKLNEHLAASDPNAKLTITTLFVKAVSNALKKVPIMNSKFDVQTQDKYVLYHNHNVSIAIDTPIGLLVPNIKNVENLSLSEVQAELNILQGLASTGKLGPAHLTGGTISISNVGVIGGTAVRPILFDGQAVILGLGRLQKLPRYNPNTKSFDAADFMNVTATVDHRHVDGATVARFMKW